MGSMQLQPRPLYGIGTVARLTGIKPDTLRIWERRYQLGASYKSPSGRRQYSQADLEHLQLVAALVAAGTRIGEIAGSDRRTLEMLLRIRKAAPPRGISSPKARVLFVGIALCQWLEEHQGCLSNIDAMLAPCPLDEVGAYLGQEQQGFDELVVECATLGGSTQASLDVLAERTGNGNVLVLYAGTNQRARQSLEEQGIRVGEFPPESSYLAFHFNRGTAQRDAQRGSNNLGELVDVQGRVFSDRDLSLARALQGKLACECPTHLADLVSALAQFEDYSAQCSVDNWQDASLHACVYAYAGQARWLMEKALSLVADAHQQTLDEEVQTRH